MIAHFNELEWCQSYGVDRSLIRIWAGQEDQGELSRTFKEALEVLHDRE